MEQKTINTQIGVATKVSTKTQVLLGIMIVACLGGVFAIASSLNTRNTVTKNNMEIIENEFNRAEVYKRALALEIEKNLGLTNQKVLLVEESLVHSTYTDTGSGGVPCFCYNPNTGHRDHASGLCPGGCSYSSNCPGNYHCAVNSGNRQEGTNLIIYYYDANS